MVLTISTDPTPLNTNAEGAILVGQTRVTLATVIAAFQQGATAEEIASRYPSLRLADIYGAIAFYLNHQAEVEAYLQQQQQESQETRNRNESRFNSQALRNRLLARKA